MVPSDIDSMSHCYEKHIYIYIYIYIYKHMLRIWLFDEERTLRSGSLAMCSSVCAACMLPSADPSPSTATRGAMPPALLIAFFLHTLTAIHGITFVTHTGFVGAQKLQSRRLTRVRPPCQTASHIDDLWMKQCTAIPRVSNCSLPEVCANCPAESCCQQNADHRCCAWCAGCNLTQVVKAKC